MVHAREDYDRFQDPALKDPTILEPGHTPIAHDEPVFLLRAQDENFIPMLEDYRDLWNTKRDVADKINHHIERARKWQAQHPPKTPDL